MSGGNHRADLSTVDTNVTIGSLAWLRECPSIGEGLKLASADLGAALGPITAEDDSEIHQATAHPDWREAWWFVFFDQATGIHGVAYLYAYPNQDRGACLFGLWQGDRGLHLVRDFNVPMSKGADFRSIAGLTVSCVEPNERWSIGFRSESVTLDLEWTSITPVYEWEWGGLVGSRRYEQSGAFVGSVTVGTSHWDFDGVGQRDRAWGPRSFAVVQQCWSSRVHFARDFLSHQSIVTVGGRDCLFGYLLMDGALQPLKSLDLTIGFGYEGGPPILTRAQLVDCADRELTYFVTPVNVVSTVLAGTDRVNMHTTFSRFEAGDRSAIGHLDHWFSDPGLVRSHLAVRNRSLGRFVDE
jgi:hypothetical protein